MAQGQILTAADTRSRRDIEDLKVLIATLQGQICPVGSIFMYGAEAVPVGWIICEGSSVLRAGTYAALFAVIGTAFGYNDATHFNLPDLRGKFTRGWSNGTTNDPDKAARTASWTNGATGDHVGSSQADDYKAHSHGVGTLSVDAMRNSGSGLIGKTVGGSYGNAGATISGSTDTKPASGGAETRPINIYLNFIIKY